jgi:hypothetical protein
MELYGLLAELELGNRVRWLCQVDYSCMPRLYSMVSRSGGCVVVTSSDESFGMSVAEAMVCGCPIIATRVGALPELITHGETGFLFRLHDVDEGARYVGTLLGDVALRHHFIEAAARRVNERCSLETVCRTYLDLVQNLWSEHLKTRGQTTDVRPVALPHKVSTQELSAASSPSQAMASTPVTHAALVAAQVRRIQLLVELTVPARATVVAISRGDDRLLQLGSRKGWHFPQTSQGVYAGYHPGNSESAIADLEKLRAQGGTFLLIPSTAFWWLEFYTDFRRHLETKYRPLAYQEDTCIIFDLTPTRSDRRNNCELIFHVDLGKQLVRTASKNRNRNPATQRTRSVLKQSNARIPVVGPDAGRSLEGPSQSTHSETAATSLTSGCILDEFSALCFRPESNLVFLRPDNWRNILERTRVDMLFVESGWRGDSNAREKKVAAAEGSNVEALLELVDYCKRNGIRTVFWNKEDPSHFDSFIRSASSFDHVLTSDAGMISDLIRPVLSYGLQIYEGQHGVPCRNPVACRFPEAYHKASKGRLEYPTMVPAYKQYNVFLNLNSVKQSSTRFSRRVFEILVSGTPVISFYYKQLMLPRDEHTRVNGISPGSTLINPGRLRPQHWEAVIAGRASEMSGLRFFSIDKFNCLRNGASLPESLAWGWVDV